MRRTGRLDRHTTARHGGLPALAWCSLTALLLALAPAAQAQAQAQNQAPAPAPAYPDKPVRFVVPYPPGGGTDVIARIVQQKFATLLGQPVVIENRGGAGGSVGSEAVAKAAPDGYTVLFTLSSHTINPAIFKKLNYDTARDFEPVGLVASLPQILVAHPQFPANTLAEMTALAKARPGLAFASVGNGSPGHLAGELQALRTQVPLTHIPYKGGGPAMTDVIGGQVPTLWVSIPAAAAFVKSGKVKALAVSTARRSAALPEAPTLAEAADLAGYDCAAWVGYAAPAGTPRDILVKLAAEIQKAVQAADLKERYVSLGMDTASSTPDEMMAFLRREQERYGQIIKNANIKVEN